MTAAMSMNERCTQFPRSEITRPDHTDCRRTHDDQFQPSRDAYPTTRRTNRHRGRTRGRPQLLGRRGQTTLPTGWARTRTTWAMPAHRPTGPRAWSSRTAAPSRRARPRKRPQKPRACQPEPERDVPCWRVWKPRSFNRPTPRVGTRQRHATEALDPCAGRPVLGRVRAASPPERRRASEKHGVSDHRNRSVRDQPVGCGRRGSAPRAQRSWQGCFLFGCRTRQGVAGSKDE